MLLIQSAVGFNALFHTTNTKSSVLLRLQSGLTDQNYMWTKCKVSAPLTEGSGMLLNGVLKNMF